LSHVPSVLAAQALMTFPRPQNRNALESLFLDLLMVLFDIGSVDEKLLGHVKLYGEGKFKSIVRANVTGARENSRIEVRCPKAESYVKVWLNVIAYKLDGELLRKNFLTAFNNFAKQRHVRLHGLRIAHRHDHF